MLHGNSVLLRPVQAADVDRLYSARIDIANRGAFFPLGVRSESDFRRSYSETGGA